MPYTIAERNGKYCVHKRDENGDPMGESMGCHDTMEEAQAQMGAIMHSEENKSFTYIKEDSEGNLWFVGLYSNKFEDRDEEILSEQAHEEYVTWANEKGFKPVVTLYHLPRQPQGFWNKLLDAYEEGRVETEAVNNLLKSLFAPFAIAQTEHLFMTNGFAGVLAKVFPDKIEGVKRLASKGYDLGMSHGFTNVEFGDKIFSKYRSFEFSVLLRDRAANVYTSSSFLEDSGVLTDKDKELLNAVSPELADRIDEDTSKAAKELEDAGVSFKEETPVEEGTPEPVEQPVEVEEAESDEQKTYKALLPRLVADLGLGELQEVLKSRFELLDNLNSRIEEATKRLDDLTARLQEVEQDDDSKIASMYAPINWAAATSRPTADMANVVKQMEEKKETALPGWDDQGTAEFRNLWTSLNK